MNALRPSSSDVFPKRSPSAVGAAPTVKARLDRLRELALKGLFVIILGIALGTSGPYGTYGTVPVLIRLGFWICILLVPWALWEVLMAMAKSILPNTIGERMLMALLMPVFAVIGSLFATGFSAWVFGFDDLTYAQAWANSLTSWLLFSFLIVLPLAIIADALSRHQRHIGGESLLGFFTLKLPTKLQGSVLIALQSEGHYLRVFTSAGDDLILMSMEDAMAALSAYPGVRTHRSWWIAVDQIAPEFTLDGAFTSIPTRTGPVVPVSRRRRKFVRDQVGHYRDFLRAT